MLRVRWLPIFWIFSVFDNMTDVDLHPPKHTHWHPFIVIWTHPHSGRWTHTEARHDSTSGSGCQRVSHTLARARLLGSPGVAYIGWVEMRTQNATRLAQVGSCDGEPKLGRWKKRLGAAWSLPTCTSSEAFAFKDVKACVGRWCFYGVI